MSFAVDRLESRRDLAERRLSPKQTETGGNGVESQRADRQAGGHWLSPVTLTLERFRRRGLFRCVERRWGDARRCPHWHRLSVDGRRLSAAESLATPSPIAQGTFPNSMSLSSVGSVRLLAQAKLYAPEMTDGLRRASRSGRPWTMCRDAAPSSPKRARRRAFPCCAPAV